MCETWGNTSLGMLGFRRQAQLSIAQTLRAQENNRNVFSFYFVVPDTFSVVLN